MEYCLKRIQFVCMVITILLIKGSKLVSGIAMRLGYKRFETEPFVRLAPPTLRLQRLVYGPLNVNGTKGQESQEIS
jgi:hypothetical protein